MNKPRQQELYFYAPWVNDVCFFVFLPVSSYGRRQGRWGVVNGRVVHRLLRRLRLRRRAVPVALPAPLPRDGMYTIGAVRVRSFMYVCLCCCRIYAFVFSSARWARVRAPCRPRAFQCCIPSYNDNQQIQSAPVSMLLQKLCAALNK